ncbi:MAG: HAD family hydrolase [Muribaculaceae bacterium]|nr:HAD family hydrolase [Muribaculaceae bacterium]
MKQLVIFDLDGTLLDTRADLGMASNYALEQLGYPTHPLSAYPMYVGNGVKRLLARVLPPGTDTPERVEELRSVFKEYYDAHNTVHTSPYPGITELLEILQNRGVKLAVASNKYHDAVVKLIKHYFPGIEWAAIEGQKEDRPVKPDPSIVFEILSQNPTPKADVLYVGDSGVDMETARRACVDSVGVTWGFRQVSELREFNATYVVNEAKMILSLVENV